MKNLILGLKKQEQREVEPPTHCHREIHRGDPHPPPDPLHTLFLSPASPRQGIILNLLPPWALPTPTHNPWCGVASIL